MSFVLLDNGYTIECAEAWTVFQDAINKSNPTVQLTVPPNNPVKTTYWLSKMVGYSTTKDSFNFVFVGVSAATGGMP